MKNASLVAATFVLAIGTGFVVAQTGSSAPPSTTPPTTTPPTGNPPTGNNPPPSDMQSPPRSNMVPQSGRPASMMPPDFNTLDRNGVGFLTEKDAAGNAWLRTHFTTCDTNRDRQVSEAEYTTCARNR
jgi:hypothetical protein